jgi:hypothetical protein
MQSPEGHTETFRRRRSRCYFLYCASASAQVVNDQNDQPHNQQQVDQASTDVQAETEEPQNQKNNENRPEHVNLLCSFASAPL